MPRLQPHSWYLILILPFILIISAWFLVSEGRLYQSAHYGKLYNTYILWLTPGSEVRQEFVANYPGLNQVDVFVKNLNPAATTEITFQLRSTCQDQNDLRRQVAVQPQGEIDGQTFYSFSFTSLEGSTRQTYCFILKADTGKGDEKLIGVLTGEGDVYPDGQLFYRELLLTKSSDQPQASPIVQPASQGEHKLFLPMVQAHLPADERLDLAFQLHYQGSRFETSQVFFARLVEHKPYFWGNPGFYGLLFIAYILGVIAFIGVVGNETRI